MAVILFLQLQIKTIQCYYSNVSVYFHSSVADYIGFDLTVLQQDEWQIVLKYLQCDVKEDYTYTLSRTKIVDPYEALGLLLRYV